MAGPKTPVIPKIFKHWVLKALMTPLLAGLVLGILAPFGTNLFPIGFRFLYWIGLAVAGGLGALLVDVLLQKRTPKPTVWLWSFLQSAGATLAVAPFVFGLSGPTNPAAVVLTLFYIWVVAIVITAVGQLAARKRTTSTPDTNHPPILDRLPPKFRKAEIYAISAEDHYVRVHSAVGEHMLLMRLTDAEAFAAPLKGIKPHRSWWVAEAGVESVKKSEGKLLIKLKTGTIVPVSREGGKRVRAAGWI
jgi:DNA-binding LytR/AlgR family response regulator